MRHPRTSWSWLMVVFLAWGCADAGAGDDDAASEDDDSTADDDAGTDDDTTFPDDDAGTPDDDATDDDSSSPDDDTGAPDDDTGTPDDDTGTPDDDTGTPDDDTGTPDDDTGAPDDDATPPDDDTGAPDDDSSPPDDDTTPPPPPEVVRFAALGDTGEGNTDQYLVSEVMKSVCDTRGCDFVLLLGDNIYDSGVDSPTDPDWDSLFELPYAAFDIPFYPVLGNHDYGGEGIGWELWKGQYEVDHTDYSPIWTMPDIYHTFTAGPAAFFALDTTQAFWWLAEGQKSDVQSWISASTATWKFAFGHHPYLSNGPHGDAGNYEGLWFLPIVNGEGVQDLLDDVVCGQVDLYLCGHDHSRQFLTETCDDTMLIVSGAGAKNTDLEGSHAVEFESEVEGFFWFEVVGNEMTIATYDKNGLLEYEGLRTK
ncbi:metallophosphoesterase [Myxococcota bacterium]|nr:metallophosphoesterase [Myxococcota bacterium]